ncbi:MAG: Flp family type IVb pilin [Actinomycetota bacterium]|nr:Flp family type IVb pilin [Actinomycetota bacterium]
MFLAVQAWVESRATKTLDQRGVTAAEYALLIALIAVIVAVTIEPLGQAISSVFQEMTGAL